MTERLTVVDASGRRKAYRPLPAADRAAALAAGLAAYERGDFFEAHERLEPAWMGSPDPVERAALQGLIKLAAGYVHDVRGNAVGMRKNLEGARARLIDGRAAGDLIGVDVDALVGEIDRRIADLDHHPDGPTLAPPTLMPTTLAPPTLMPPTLAPATPPTNLAPAAPPTNLAPAAPPRRPR